MLVSKQKKYTSTHIRQYAGTVFICYDLKYTSLDLPDTLNLGHSGYGWRIYEPQGPEELPEVITGEQDPQYILLLVVS